MSRLKSVAYWSENHNHEEEINNQNNITQIKYQVTVKHLTVHSTKENNKKKPEHESIFSQHCPYYEWFNSCQRWPAASSYNHQSSPGRSSSIGSVCSSHRISA